MIAATQRQTAAPVANVKSEIHMRASLVLFSARGNRVRERAVNAQPEYPFLELFGYNNTSSFRMEPSKSYGFVLPSLKPPHLTAALPTFDVV
jgi:hypothetical protein